MALPDPSDIAASHNVVSKPKSQMHSPDKAAK